MDIICRPEIVIGDVIKAVTERRNAIDALSKPPTARKRFLKSNIIVMDRHDAHCNDDCYFFSRSKGA